MNPTSLSLGEPDWITLTIDTDRETALAGPGLHPPSLSSSPDGWHFYNRSLAADQENQFRQALALASTGGHPCHSVGLAGQRLP